MKSAGKRLVMCGVTHRTSTVEQREPLQIGNDELAHANAVLYSLPHVLECIIVSTCNRVEFYFVTDPDRDPMQTIVDFYKVLRDRDLSASSDLFLIRKGSHAADHLFRVAAGIDSVVLGENQVLGQIREAYSSSCAVKTAGKVIHRLFHQAFRVGKQARTDTGMGKGACSISSAAVEMLKEGLDDEARPVVLLVGVNQMISLAASRLSRSHHSKMLFANRTPEKAMALATKYHGEGSGLDSLPELLRLADIVLSCTSAPEPIIDATMIDNAVDQRADRRLTVVDLAIPRDVDYGKNTRPEVAVHDLEDIKAFVEEQQKQRQEAVPQVEEIIDKKLTEFRYWWQHVKEEPLYNGQGVAIEDIVEEEIAPLLDRCPVSFKNELGHVTRRIIKRVAEVARSEKPRQENN